VRVVEDGVNAIKLDLPPEAATDLPAIMPSSVLAQLASDGTIDLAALSQSLQRDGIAPQELFKLDTGRKQCRVWLE
jgi:hypothetical protein